MNLIRLHSYIFSVFFHVKSLNSQYILWCEILYFSTLEFWRRSSKCLLIPVECVCYNLIIIAVNICFSVSTSGIMMLGLGATDSGKGNIQYHRQHWEDEDDEILTSFQDILVIKIVSPLSVVCCGPATIQDRFKWKVLCQYWWSIGIHVSPPILTFLHYVYNPPIIYSSCFWSLSPHNNMKVTPSLYKAYQFLATFAQMIKPFCAQLCRSDANYWPNSENLYSLHLSGAVINISLRHHASGQ